VYLYNINTWNFIDILISYHVTMLFLSIFNWYKLAILEIETWKWIKFQTNKLNNIAHSIIYVILSFILVYYHIIVKNKNWYIISYSIYFEIMMILYFIQYIIDRRNPKTELLYQFKIMDDMV